MYQISKAIFHSSTLKQKLYKNNTCYSHNKNPSFIKTKPLLSLFKIPAQMGSLSKIFSERHLSARIKDR